MNDRCPVCDRPPTAWKPPRALADSRTAVPLVFPPVAGMLLCVVCGADTLGEKHPAQVGPHRHAHALCASREMAEHRNAAASDPSVCWGGEECRAHAVDWRARCREAEGHLFEARRRGRALEAALRRIGYDPNNAADQAFDPPESE